MIILSTRNFRLNQRSIFRKTRLKRLSVLKGCLILKKYFKKMQLLKMDAYDLAYAVAYAFASFFASAFAYEVNYAVAYVPYPRQ